MGKVAPLGRQEARDALLHEVDVTPRAPRLQRRVRVFDRGPLLVVEADHHDVQHGRSAWPRKLGLTAAFRHSLSGSSPSHRYVIMGMRLEQRTWPTSALEYALFVVYRKREDKRKHGVKGEEGVDLVMSTLFTEVEGVRETMTVSYH